MPLRAVAVCARRVCGCSADSRARTTRMKPPGERSSTSVRSMLRSGGEAVSGSRGGSSSSMVRFKCALHNTVLDVLRSRGWRETESELDWDLFWADVMWIRETFDHVHLEDHQRVNHFRNHYELSRKDHLIKNLKRMRKQLEREGRHAEAAKYNFFPQTYVLPNEYALYVEEFKRGHSDNNVWIMKPTGKAQGRGIFLINKLSQISEWKKDHRWKGDASQTTAESYIVQKYIGNPYLIGGKKFDIRLYVLVTSYSPLTVWMYRSGFARFSNHRFNMNVSEIDNNYIHLTNVAIQKHSDLYDERNGGKWDLTNLKMHLTSKHDPDTINDLFTNIQALILRSLLAVQKVMIQDKHCFELYGYDILIDDTLKPWLLEVNASPSLTANTPADYHMKTGLLHDVLSVVDMERKLSSTEDQVGGFDLIYQNGPVRWDRDSAYTTFLGCFNDRETQLRKLEKACAGARAEAGKP